MILLVNASAMYLTTRPVMRMVIVVAVIGVAVVVTTSHVVMTTAK